MSNAVSLRTPKYRHHKAKNLAVVTIAGRDIYLGKYGTEESKQEYRRLVAEYIQSGSVIRSEHTAGISVVEVMAAYLKFAHGYYRKAGKLTRDYGLIVECCRFIKPLYARTLATEFGPLALKAVRQQMIEAGHSRKYINKNVERIRRMFKWAAGEELLPASVPQALAMVTGLRKGRTPARETKPVPPVEDIVVEAMIPHLPEVIADMVRLQRLTGMRPGEVCILRPMDLDRSRDVWTYRPESHKTEHHDRERIVFIGPQAQAVLLRYLARDVAAYCFRPCDSEAKRRAARHAARRTPITCGNVPGTNRKANPKRQAGEHYDTGAYRRAIQRACDKAGVPDWAPNQLRHTAATMIRREFGLECAQVVWGHAQANVTQLYAERDLAKGIEVARRIG